MVTTDWMERLGIGSSYISSRFPRLLKSGNAGTNASSPQPVSPAPYRQGSSIVDYIWGEARRRRMKPWELPGLSFLAPPSIGNTRSRANNNPLAWLRALEEALRAGAGHDPTNLLRNLVGRSPSYLPFSTNEAVAADTPASLAMSFSFGELISRSR